MTKKVHAPGLIVLLSVICLASIASAQMSWWRTYGGTGDDEGYSVQQTTDGGYAIAGHTYSFGAGSADVYLVKVNSWGDTLWTRTYGGANWEAGRSVQQTTDGGYIITGNTNSFGAGYSDVYLIKTDSLGETLWTRTYGGPSNDVGSSVQQTADGGYIIAGWADFRQTDQPVLYLIKTDASGDTLWTRSEEGIGHPYRWGMSVQQTTDGGYAIAGFYAKYDRPGGGPHDFLLVKTDAQGDTLWTRTYGGSTYDEGYSVQQTADGGYILTGWAGSFGAGGRDVYLIKTDSLGNALWTRTYGGTYNDAGNSVEQTTDGGYIIAGWTYSFGAGTPDSGNVYLIKTNASGDTLWTRTFGGTGDDQSRSVKQTTDGGYIITGYTYSFGAGGADVYLIKTDSLGLGVAEPPARQPVRHTRLLVQPNPFTSSARVPGHETELFVLSDITGRQVAVCRGDRIGAGLGPGVYFLSPVGLRAGKSATAIIVKTAF